MATNDPSEERLITSQTDSMILHEDNVLGPDVLSGEEGEGHGKHGNDGDKKIGIFGSAMNISNTIMGAGILALPVVVAQFGIVLGLGIIIFSCTLTYFSCCLLLKSKNLCRHSKFITISQHCFGPAGLWVVKMIIIINNIGLSVIYLIIFSNVTTNLVGGFVTQCKIPDDGNTSNLPFYCSSAMLKIFGAVCVSPFIFAKNMAKLSEFSFFGVVASSTFSLVTIGYFGYAVIEGTNAQDINVLPDINKPVKALASVTSVFLAFTFQFNFFPVYKSLKDPTDARMRKVTKVALGVVLTIFVSVATCGYLTFGGSTDNLLKNFTLDLLGAPIFILINITFLISSTSTFPLMFFGARNNVYGAIILLRKKFGCKRKITKKKSIQQNKENDQNQKSEEEDDPEDITEVYGFSPFGYIVYVIMLYLVTVLMAIYVPGINEVFDFVGSTAANGLNFLLPSAFYLKLAPKKGRLLFVGRLIMIVGIVMGVVGLVSSTLDLIDQSSSSSSS
mmetsp:Transcript_35361/g.31832  ORF Transcript_35361/g.31832 Transcript_35361/m.31832 type:complete len:503 (-) Transcript_35361:242-1750(-)|eukprot:CAMPEP_0114588718 /NCGR_PEP_ID=MMETSP0125-20121206/11356_1 /TAXON_ID=485358 ORGANISM="Aristerostoma sp., Strain ATCC 50986" /NCGR_SAMPLE_ID=MMETSP0125 /ASSEMBLY_ACC=CAM_ASM_000245 /LENGTH=502 /DNA_ID=CAMNT_0001785265 /DNA_START=86 /DNA_END=1594 /DNA_ORIENTATION=-